MSESGKLQRRSQELAKLSVETSDDRMRIMLKILSGDFKREADRLAAMDERDDHLPHFGPRNYQT
jgi:hypothetical protein